MKYDKPAFTWEEQADLLIQRGMQADREELTKKLRCVNYYRLSGYWHPFRVLLTNGRRGDYFVEGTSFDEVWRRYLFDRQLRVLMLDAIERFEVTLRTQLTYRLSHDFGAFGYANESNFPERTPFDWEKLAESYKKNTERAHGHEVFVDHFFEKYDDEKILPMWMMCELLSLGDVMYLYRVLDAKRKYDVTMRVFQMHPSVFISWIGTLHAVRNICAHHGRLFNKTLGYRPVIPNKWQGIWKNTPDNRLFCLLMILYYILQKIAPQSQWGARMENLLAAHSDLHCEMGFPADWLDFREKILSAS